MTAKSVNERKAAERARRRESGLVKLELWVKPELRQRIVDYVKRLVKQTQ